MSSPAQIESGKELQICPKWRKFVVSGSKALALCGSAFHGERQKEIPDFGPRLNYCPYYNLNLAYKIPAIIEADLSQLEVDYGMIYRPVVNASCSGREGIQELERVWNREVEAFYRRIQLDT